MNLPIEIGDVKTFYHISYSNIFFLFFQVAAEVEV